MYDPMPGNERRIGREEVIEKFGVPPEKVLEVQALIGDTDRQVPGVPGIGVKTAAQLIGEYGDLETLLARAGEIKQPKRREALIEYRRAGAHVETAGDAGRPGRGRMPARPALPRRPRCLEGGDAANSSPSSRRWSSPRSPSASARRSASTPTRSRPTPACAPTNHCFRRRIWATRRLPRTQRSARRFQPGMRRRTRLRLLRLRRGRREVPHAPALTASAPRGPEKDAAAGPFTPRELAARHVAEAAAQKVDRARYVSISDAAVLDVWIAKATERGVWGSISSPHRQIR